MIDRQHCTIASPAVVLMIEPVYPGFNATRTGRNEAAPGPMPEAAEMDYERASLPEWVPDQGFMNRTYTLRGHERDIFELLEVECHQVFSCSAWVVERLATVSWMAA